MATGGADIDWKHAGSIYPFSAKDIDGNVVSMEKYRGKVVMVINVACKWGSTAKYYPQLQALYTKYQQDGFEVAAFPCNQFASQEPWPEPEIKKYVKENFGATFDLYAKIDVNGDNAHPLWKYLKSKQGGILGDFVKWNFTKFLIDRNGQPVARTGPKTDPNESEADICKLLGVAKK